MIPQLERFLPLELATARSAGQHFTELLGLLESTVKILKFGTPQTIAIIVLKIEKFDVTLH